MTTEPLNQYHVIFIWSNIEPSLYKTFRLNENDRNRDKQLGPTVV